MEKDSGIKVSKLAVDGGGSTNDFLMQFMADIANVNIVRPAAVEATALGAAHLAGLAAGVCGAGFGSGADGETVFVPNTDKAAREALLRGWHEAVRKSRA